MYKRQVLQNSDDARKLFDAFPAAENRDGVVIFKNASANQAEPIMSYIVAQHIPIIRFERHEPDLDDLFMEVIGR